MQLLLLTVANKPRYQKVAEQLTNTNNQWIVKRAQERIIADFGAQFKESQKNATQLRDSVFSFLLN